MSSRHDAALDLAWEARREGRLAEAAARYDELLDLGPELLAPALRRRALSGRAQVHRDGGQVPDAVLLLDEAIDLARSTDDTDGLVHALRHAAEARLDLSPPQPERAVPLALEALELLRSGGAQGLTLANAVRVAALAAAAAGEVERARTAWREAHALYEAAGIEAGAREAREALVRLALG